MTRQTRSPLTCGLAVREVRVVGLGRHHIGAEFVGYGRLQAVTISDEGIILATDSGCYNVVHETRLAYYIEVER